ncbi:SUR1 [Sanghuangporus sanghuang]
MTLPPVPQQAAIGYGGPPPAQGHPHSDYLPSYIHQLSDLRTGSGANKRKRTGSSSALSTAPSLQNEHEAAINGVGECLFDSLVGTPQDVCADCVVDCDDADCQAASIDECTEQCVVVPCNDESACPSGCSDVPCHVEKCNGGDQCFGALNDSLQLLCCTNLHECNETSSSINWNCSLDEILGVNGSGYGFPSSSHLSLLNPQLNNATTNAAQNFSGINPSLSFQDKSIIPGNSLPSPHEATTPVTAVSQPLNQSAVSNDFVCRWSGCNLPFGSLNELVGHVNLTHLRPPPSSLPQPSKKLRLDSSVRDGLPLSCHWDDCRLYPNASTLPGPSTGLQPEMAFDLLSSHFFHDHLGLAVPPTHALPVFQSSNETETNMLPVSSNATQLVETNAPTTHAQSDSKSAQNLSPVDPTYATPEPSPPPDTTPPLSSSSTSLPHDCSTSTHTCHWQSCGESFPTCAALTEHLALAHVGSGKGHYDCHWGDCQRSGKQGFTSKQKIMRHLQAHTGHRPFLCKECGQHFSEAATLAQHMRRHTQEKPFVCDFPGCGKAFAITGALTIHKRTHNGERPFRCPHCDRAFAESSNLSKHLRTHTGDKPYRCSEPGCGKAFARPDQLQRHGNVHTKRKAVGATATSDGASAAAAATSAVGGEAIVVK